MSNRPRKTIEVKRVLEKGNASLRLTPDECVEHRKAIASFMETLLFDADAYAGFGYLDGHQRKHLNDTDRDETRRVYLHHSKIR